ncbi:phage tail tape measure protein [Rhizobiales bacterium]|uniref:phage tail tape measure protein n=1 Tax=Hongsoonwoonella zoysiae TaxID=2821844 RepID=UPI00156088F5|nr:phage tail tape measure protein [Hongsoonwoonella zoysiae]NRG19389.1 phage tail tape measure protein [Hongsoonwoonella zoysiae]
MPDDPVAVDIPTQELNAFSRRLDAARVSADAISRSLRGGLRDALADGARLDSLFRSIALRLSSRLLDRALRPVEQGLGAGLSRAFSGIGNLAAGGISNALSGPRVTPFAKGGVIAAPTFFPAGNGLGLAGEAGPEAVLPLQRGTNGRLGVAVNGGEGKNPPIVFNITTRDAESFMRSETQISAMVARAVGRGRRGL